MIKKKNIIQIDTRCCENRKLSWNTFSNYLTFIFSMQFLSNYVFKIECPNKSFQFVNNYNVARQKSSCSGTYTMRNVLVYPEPFFHPVTTTTGSPAWMNPRALPNLMACTTRVSTSFNQSLNGCSTIINCIWTSVI